MMTEPPNEYVDVPDCRPLRSNSELLAFHREPFPWSSLVERLDVSVKGVPRLLGNEYEDMDADFQQIQKEEEVSRPKVLVCHDLAGNYRGDRFLSGSLKWDDYRFYHWTGIDLFCYFSHDYVTIPTFAWIQAAHRHGVAVLGTLIFESNEGYRNIVEILQSEESMQAVVEALVFVAKQIHFEGWLLNVECSLGRDMVPMLRQFVERLTQRTHEDVPHGKIIWYDSIIDSGWVRWQNELNAKNKQFFDACDGILINYNWNETHLMRSVEAVARSATEMAKIFVGIDVFGRGQVSGFLSNQNMAKIRRFKLSVGIFAPGWTFEKVTDLGINHKTTRGTDICNWNFIERNNRFWALLWPSLYTSSYAKLPFYSSFCIGSGKQRYQDGILCEPVTSWLKLDLQSLQPSVPQHQMEYSFEESFSGGCMVRVLPGAELSPRRLFVVDWQLGYGLVVAYAYKSVARDEDVCLWLRLESSTGKVSRIECSSEEKRFLPSVGKQRRIFPLSGSNLRAVYIHIVMAYEKSLPKMAPNDWKVRYYYVTCSQPTERERVTDIGFGTQHGGLGTYLGAVHVHGGNEALNNLLS